MPLIDLPKDQKTDTVARLKRYLEDECDVELGSFQVEFLLDKVIELIGPQIHNAAVMETEQWFAERFQGLCVDVYELEK